MVAFAKASATEGGGGMRVLLVARTAGPMKNLARVAQELTDRNHEVASVFSKDAESMVNVHALMGFRPNVILVATSTANISDELAVIARARDEKTPYAVFADTYGAYNRKEVPIEMRRDCATVFVPDETEKLFVPDAGYPTAVVSGVPLWEDFADLSKFPSREEMRKNLGLRDDDLAFVWTPGKDGELNKKVFRQVFQALRQLNTNNLVLLPRFHPGDPDLKSNPHYYDELMAECPVRTLDSGNYKKTDDLVPALDFVISSASTVGITAIYQRKQVIEYLPSEWVDRMEQQIGRRVWPPAQCGAALMSEDPYQLSIDIVQILTAASLGGTFGEYGRCNLRRSQEINYPIEKGGAAKRIADSLEKIAR